MIVIRNIPFHILGLLRPQKGKITLNDVVLTEQPTKFKREVAYIPETPILYPELTLKEHLELTMLSYKQDEKKAWERAHELLKMFRLDDRQIPAELEPELNGLAGERVSMYKCLKKISIS